MTLNFQDISIRIGPSYQEKKFSADSNRCKIIVLGLSIFLARIFYCFGAQILHFISPNFLCVNISPLKSCIFTQFNVFTVNLQLRTMMVTYKSAFYKEAYKWGRFLLRVLFIEAVAYWRRCLRVMLI